jgi:hypothetical protein
MSSTTQVIEKAAKLVKTGNIFGLEELLESWDDENKTALLLEAIKLNSMSLKTEIADFIAKSTKEGK